LYVALHTLCTHSSKTWLLDKTGAAVQVLLMLCSCVIAKYVLTIYSKNPNLGKSILGEFCAVKSPIWGNLFWANLGP